MIEIVREFWPQLFGALVVALSAVLTVRVILDKRDERAAVGWVGLIWLSPVLGAVLYMMLGVNRIRRRADRLRHDRERAVDAAGQAHIGHHAGAEPPPEPVGQLPYLSNLIDKVTPTPLTSGNAIVPLFNGDDAYAAMIDAINGAQHSVGLCSYIFNNDRAGRLFVDALGAAVDRGVEVRVMIDGLGSLYSIPSVVSRLRKRRVPVARFLHSFVPWRMPYLNLRNHRKIMVVDGRIGFTGSMNIREEYLSLVTDAPIKDIHFRLDGPVVAHLAETFAEEWAFTTDEILGGDAWFPAIGSAGDVVARGVVDGPDLEFDRLRWTLLGAVTEARKSIVIVTPYFLPGQTLATALMLAAMRGLQVDIILPDANNLVFIKWAAAAQVDEILLAGCRIWMSPAPFDHSKLMLVDDTWTLFGSANWDPRSLRLNFEFNVECYDPKLAERLQRLVSGKLAEARPLTLEELRERSLPVKVRDGIARLFAPYL